MITKKDRKSPSLVDIRVGKLIRQQRKNMGMTQEKLGELLGITFQQVQKYEKGINRVSASRLQDISQILQVSPSFFFCDEQATFESDFLPTVQPTTHTLKEPSVPYVESDSQTELDYMKLLQYFTKISDPMLKQQLINLAESLSKLKK